jgi:hypothetical protein
MINSYEKKTMIRYGEKQPVNIFKNATYIELFQAESVNDVEILAENAYVALLSSLRCL